MMRVGGLRDVGRARRGEVRIAPGGLCGRGVRGVGLARCRRIQWGRGGVGLRAAGRRGAAKLYSGASEALAVPSVAGGGLSGGGG